MELTPLKYFCKLAEVLSFTEAAKDLFITQSTLSQSIKQLEEELGTPLFDRIGKKIYITETGRSFLKYAHNALEEIHAGIEDVKEKQLIFNGRIRIGVIHSLYPFISTCILKFSRRYPDAQLSIHYSHSILELVDMVSNNQLDFALSYKPDEISPLLEIRSFLSFPLCVIADRNHPAAVRKVFDLNDLNDYPLVLFPETLYTRKVIERMLLKYRIKVRPQVEVNSTTILLEMISTGHWISILSQDIARHNPDLKSIPIKGSGESMHAAFLSLKGKKKSLLTEKFIDMLKEVHQEDKRERMKEKDSHNGTDFNPAPNTSSTDSI